MGHKRAVLPPLAAILAPENTNIDTKISALHDLSFLVVRPPSTSTEMVNFCLGNPVESLLVSPIILSLFSVRSVFLDIVIYYIHPVIEM